MWKTGSLRGAQMTDYMGNEMGRAGRKVRLTDSVVFFVK